LLFFNKNLSLLVTYMYNSTHVTHVLDKSIKLYTGWKISNTIFWEYIMNVMYKFNNKFFYRFKYKSIYERCNFLCELQFMLNTPFPFNLIIAFTHNINWPWALPWEAANKSNHFILYILCRKGAWDSEMGIQRPTINMSTI
jgi:hypothetical protein